MSHIISKKRKTGFLRQTLDIAKFTMTAWLNCNYAIPQISVRISKFSWDQHELIGATQRQKISWKSKIFSNICMTAFLTALKSWPLSWPFFNFSIFSKFFSFQKEGLKSCWCHQLSDYILSTDSFICWWQNILPISKNPSPQPCSLGDMGLGDRVETFF